MLPPIAAPATHRDGVAVSRKLLLQLLRILRAHAVGGRVSKAELEVVRSTSDFDEYERCVARVGLGVTRPVASARMVVCRGQAGDGARGYLLAHGTTHSCSRGHTCYHHRRCSAELRVVDVRGMDETERFAFWLNVYNLLIMHGSVTHASSLSSRLGALRVLRLHSRRFIFEVAGISISAIEIEHALLRNGHPRPAFLGTSLFFPKFSPNDPRLELAPRLPQPFVTFGLVAGTASSPPLRIYDSQGTVADLTENARQHLRRTVLSQPQVSVIPAFALKRWPRVR